MKSELICGAVKRRRRRRRDGWCGAAMRQRGKLERRRLIKRLRGGASLGVASLTIGLNLP